MSDDIVPILRLCQHHSIIISPYEARRAADEIERLRAELVQANNAIKLLIAIETA